LPERDIFLSKAYGSEKSSIVFTFRKRRCGMSTLNVVIPEMEEVKDFVFRANKLPFDMDLKNGSRIVDAKSLLGILYLGVGKVLHLELAKEDVQSARTLLGAYIVD
jgi:hypothetical protein